MEHGQTLPKVTADPHTDPGDFVAEEARIEKAKPNYIGVFIFLAILTAIEIGITILFQGSEEVGATVGRVPILLFLTVAKGLLVVLYYMHLKFDSRLYSIFFGAGVFAFALPMVIALVFLMSPPALTSVRHAEGENGVDRPVRPTANPNAGPPITFNTDGGEFFFAPDALTANSGQAVNVVLKNVGSVEHTFVVPTKTKAEDPEPWVTNDGRLVARAGPATTGRGGFIAPGPGDYVFYCNVPGHAVAGMIGTLTVR
jgi:caa(3)-type oxidase subunit IV